MDRPQPVHRRGLSFPRPPARPRTRHLFRHVRGTPGSRPRPELKKLFRAADVWQPSLQQTAGLGFLEPFPTPAQSGLPEPAPGAGQGEESPANAPPRPPAHPSATEEKAPKQTHSAEQFPVLACKGPGRLGIGLPPGCSEERSPRPAPASPPPGPSVPVVTGSPSLCSPESESMLAAARPRQRARLRGARGRSPARAVPRARCGQSRGGNPGGAVGTVRCSRGQGRLGGGERRPRPAPRARRPMPAREASAGRRMGRAGRESGRGREGASREERERPAPPGLQAGVKYPGGGVTPPPRAPRPPPGARNLRSAGEVVRVREAEPFLLGVTKSGGWFGEKPPLLK